MIKTEIFMKYILKKNQEMEFHHKKNKIKWTISPISSILKPKRSNCLIMCHSIPHFITIHFSKKKQDKYQSIQELIYLANLEVW